MKIIEMSCENYKRKYSRSVPSDIIKWGQSNAFPDQLLWLYWNSPTQQGILNRKTKLTAGQSYTFTNASAELFAKDIDFTKLFYKSILDFYLYNCFTLQIVGKTYESLIADIKYQDTSLVRLNQDTEVLNLSSDWASSKCKILKEPRLYINDQINTSGFLFITQEMPGLSHYPNPSWFSGISSIEGEINAIEAASNMIKNSFMPSGILTIPSGMSDEEEDMVAEDVKNMTGSSQTAKIFMIRQDNEKQVTWTPMAQILTAEGMQGFLDMFRQNIIIANSLTSPTIIGLPAGASLAGDGNTIDAAYKMYFDSELLPVQNFVKGVFEKLFRLAGYDTEIIINNELENKTV